MDPVSTYEPTAADRARIAARYPRRGRLDLLLALLAVITLLAAGVIFVQGGLVQSNPPVVAMVRAFDTAPQETTADIVVQRTDPSREATCFVYTQAANFERVGEMTLEVPPSEEKLTVLHVTIRTVREATAVQVSDCRMLD